LDALKNISLGKPVKVKRTNAVGCYIEWEYFKSLSV
jgi:hypothetical protein